MGVETNIAWADHTFSPWHGCTKVSPACVRCYAEALNHRYNFDNWGPGKPRRRTAPTTWNAVRRWNREAAQHGLRETIFPSMCDPWDNEVAPHWRLDFLDLVRTTPALTWLLLTKRPGNIMPMLEEAYGLAEDQSADDLATWVAKWLVGVPPKNVWIGATVVTQDEAERDANKLLAVPAKVRFFSVEPMLESMTVRAWLGPHAVNWVICGGESGPGARAMDPDWALYLRHQCRNANIAFFMKQTGSNRADFWPDVKSKKGDDPSEWPIELRVQDYPT